MAFGSQKFGDCTAAAMKIQAAAHDRQMELHFPGQGFQGFILRLTYLVVVFGAYLTGANDFPGQESEILHLFKASMSNSKNLLPSWKGKNACAFWEGVHCHEGRVTFLTLSQKGIHGKLSHNVAGLKKLVQLNLDNNEFYGDVPEEVADMPQLDYVNIQANYFKHVPAALLQRIGCKTKLTNNCLAELRGRHEQEDQGWMQRPLSDCLAFYEKKSSYMLEWKYGLGIACLTVTGLGVIGWIIWHRRKTPPSLDIPGTGELNEYPLQELLDITNNFADATLLGRGADGIVFQIRNLRGKVVAVRRLERASVRQGASDFRAEVLKFSRLNHPNIAKLLGFCVDEGERMLVYEYVEGESLYDHVHDPCNPLLAWHQRMKILVEIAYGLSHLHHDMDPPLMHGGLKSSSILLNKAFTPRIIDAGLMVLLHGGRGSNGLLTKVVDVKNMGYMDPALIQKPTLTTTSDVFAYGVLLLEVVTGRKPFQYGQSLAIWARPILDARHRWKELADARLRKNYEEGELMAVVHIAADCIQDNVRQRPLIRDVAEMLKGKLKWSLDIPSDGRSESREHSMIDQVDTEIESSLSCGGNVDTAYHVMVQDILMHRTP